jgi:hypothetical protein
MAQVTVTTSVDDQSVISTTTPNKLMLENSLLLLKRQDTLIESIDADKMVETPSDVTALPPKLVATDSDISSEVVSSPNNQLQTPIALTRQHTMGQYELAGEDPVLKEDFDIKDATAISTENSSGKKKRAKLDDIQPELLLKRQATLEVDEDVLAGAPGLYRAHSLMDAEDLLGRTPRSFYEENGIKTGFFIRNPSIDTQNVQRTRLSPSTHLFSPPSLNSEETFNDARPSSSLSEQQQTQPLQPLTALANENGDTMPAITASSSEDDRVEFNELRGITRQESWKEDVSDAGWRAW